MKVYATKSAREGSRANSEEHHDRQTNRGYSLALPDNTSYQAMADASPQVRQMARYQEMADNRPRVRVQAGSRVSGGLDPSVGSDDKNRLLGGVSNVTSATNRGPIWGDHGYFDWRVGFNAVGRPSMAGWIVQRVLNRYWGLQDGTGAPVAAPHGLTPQYWEAWAVSAAGNVTPSVGANNDYWIRPSMGANTKGNWSMSASVYFTKTDPATQGFVGGGVAAAGDLLSTTNRPDGLGNAHLHRRAEGKWDSTGATPTHTGSAK